MLTSPQNLPAWRALQSHYDETKTVAMHAQFAADPERFAKHSIFLDELLFDYSKNRISAKTIALLVDLAKQAKLDLAIKAMFSGELRNQTENRAVLHTALRNRDNTPIMVAGNNIMPEINRVLEQFTHFAQAVRSGQWLGYSGKRIRHIVNIGIGGSDLGPKMVTQALKPYWSKQLTPHFVANIDGADLNAVLRQVDAQSTLFIISSKSFTTRETIANAQAAKAWFLAQTGGDTRNINQHFVAISSVTAAVAEFGISRENTFEFWNWVGGRYSLWSAIGLPIALMIGKARFLQLLNGAHAVDKHFYQAPFERNIPVMMALLGLWYRNFYGAQSHAILPYDHHLQALPSYLQQLDMESNGKSVTRQGESIKIATGPIIWGAVGTTGQHAFFQLLHQGTPLIPIDFIAPINAKMPLNTPHCNHHQLLFANCLAQSEALMRGSKMASAMAEAPDSPTLPTLPPHQFFAGNRPSNTLLMDESSPKNIGALLALYEHKVFAQGVIWGLNSFDQWGVELGKKLAENLEDELNSGKSKHPHDNSTAHLLRHFRQRQY